MSASSRSRPTTATTPSCWTSRSSWPTAARLPRRLRRASRPGADDQHCSRQPDRRGSARPAASGGIRVDLQLIADMIAPKSRVLDVGCGDGTLLDYLVHFKQVDGRGIELSQAGVNACVSHGLSVIQGDADTDLFDYPDRRLRLRGAEPDAAGDARSQGRAAAAGAHRPPRHRLVPEFRPLADALASADPRPHAGDRSAAGQLVRHARTSISAPSGISSSWRRIWASRWSGRW